jgi:hypothetical protein
MKMGNTRSPWRYDVADPRDIRSLSRAEISGRAQAWTYLEILRELPGWEHAYLASTGPEFGTRVSTRPL